MDFTSLLLIPFLIGLVAFSFAAGFVVPVLGISLVRFDHKKVVLGFFSYMKRKSGYIASFGAGALIMALLTFVGQPYNVARWFDMYDDAVLGSLITSDDKIMKTGQIPQDILNWYSER